MPKPTYTPRAIDRLGATLVLWLWINLAANALNIVLAGVDLWLMNGLPPQTPLGPYGEIPGPELVSSITGLSRLLVLGVAIGAGFVFLKWIYRASRNAHSLVSGMTTPPPWAVGWFFVPVAMLWKPLTAFSETWRASHDPQRWKTLSTPSLLGWWWGLWLVGNLLGQVSGRMSFSAATVGVLNTATIAEFLSAVVGLPTTLIVIRMVRRLTTVQTQRLNEDVFE